LARLGPRQACSDRFAHNRTRSFCHNRAFLLLLVIALYARGPTVLHVFGTRISIYPPETLFTIVWWVLFLRGARLWRANRAAIDKIGIAGRRLFYWHAVPIAVS